MPFSRHKCLCLFEMFLKYPEYDTFFLFIIISSSWKKRIILSQQNMEKVRYGNTHLIFKAKSFEYSSDLNISALTSWQSYWNCLNFFVRLFRIISYKKREALTRMLFEFK